ncbi:terminase small subunit [Halocynthiibacter sp. C4]|uniref:terminase small subunit n=1 Tax=Halocynthiibacter sp. C4 TaxID=2992758 RepID=UPI00237B75F4|nr:terminase small subunit [Halocynthiibacter sp. C4]MDE0590428.1 terminase small subunit [Halocynthiibacter sp. C4]
MSKRDKLTEKQEAFALAYFETGNAGEAYRRAYDVEENARDSWIYVEACQLLDNPKIALKLNALREQASELAIYNVLQASAEYEAARSLAEQEKNPSAMVGAISGKVKLFGLEAPKASRHEITGKDGGAIKTEEVGQGAAKLASFLENIAERSGTDS